MKPALYLLAAAAGCFAVPLDRRAQSLAIKTVTAKQTKLPPHTKPSIQSQKLTLSVIVVATATTTAQVQPTQTAEHEASIPTATIIHQAGAGATISIDPLSASHPSSTAPPTPTQPSATPTTSTGISRPAMLAISLTLLFVFVIAAAGGIVYWSHRQTAKAYRKYRRAHHGQLLRVNLEGVVEWITPPTRTRADLGLFHVNTCAVGYGKMPPVLTARLPGEGSQEGSQEMSPRSRRTAKAKDEKAESEKAQAGSDTTAPKEDSGYVEGALDASGEMGEMGEHGLEPGERVYRIERGERVHMIDRGERKQVGPTPTDEDSEDSEEDLSDTVSYRSIDGHTAGWLRDYGYMGPAGR